MMNEEDKKCANDDNTDSFEAMEKRLKTPLRTRPIPFNTENKENECLPQATTETKVKISNSEYPSEDKKEFHIVYNSEEIVEEPEPTPVGTDGPATEAVMASLASVELVPGSPLVRSTSTGQLEGETLTPVLLQRAASLQDVSGVEEISDLVEAETAAAVLDSLEDWEQQLAQHRAEQDRLAAEEQQIRDKIHLRRQQFRQLWGVSPMSINTKRTVLHVKSEQQPGERVVTRVEQEEEEEADLVSESKYVSEENNDSFEAIESQMKTPVRPVLHPSTPDQDSDHGQLASSEELGQEPQKIGTARKVRFNSGQNLTVSVTPVSSKAGERGGRAKSRKSLDSLKSSFSFLKTPGTAGRPSRTTATPLALKKLSDRVKAEFAALYDSSDDTGEDTMDSYHAAAGPITRLDFNTSTDQ